MIRFHNGKPTHVTPEAHGGQVMLGGGNYGQFVGKAVVDLPEVAGFSVKLSGIARQYDGYFRNSATNRHFGEQEL
jgi:hypothetical protein